MEVELWGRNCKSAPSVGRFSTGTEICGSCKTGGQFLSWVEHLPAPDSTGLGSMLILRKEGLGCWCVAAGTGKAIMPSIHQSQSALRMGQCSWKPVSSLFRFCFAYKKQNWILVQSVKQPQKAVAWDFLFSGLQVPWSLKGLTCSSNAPSHGGQGLTIPPGGCGRGAHT